MIEIFFNIMKLRIIILTLILLICLPFSFTGNIISDTNQVQETYVKNISEVVTVKRVIDGDTIVIDNDERVRLLTIDTPERGQHLYKEAKEFLATMIEGKKIEMEKGTRNRDKYNRLLRFIYFEDKLVNLELIKQGLASVSIYEPNENDELFLIQEAMARQNGLGIWSFPSSDYCFGIYSLHYNAYGNDNENLNNEYITFRNKCFHSIDVSGWIISDNTSKIFIFPEMKVGAKEKLTVHSGSGENNQTNIYWNNNYAIWNNDGDVVEVWDSKGKKMIEYQY